MSKQIELADGYTGVIRDHEPGLKTWAVQKDAATIHTGYGKDDEHCIALMTAFVETGEAVAEEPKAAEPTAEEAAIEPAETTDKLADEP